MALYHIFIAYIAVCMLLQAGVFGVVVCGNAVYRFAGTDAGIVVSIIYLQVSVANAA